MLKSKPTKNVAKCHYCGAKADYIVGDGKPCCVPRAYDCPEYSKWMSDKHKKRYENTKNYYYGKTRPEHSKILLQPNEFGSLGGTGYYHAKAHELFGEDKCTVCGKTNEEELEYCKKGLIMHCKSDNWSLLTKENWKCVCSRCHKKIHVVLRKNKKEQMTTFKQLVNVVEKYPKVRNRVELFIWNMLENLNENYQERWEDV